MGTVLHERTSHHDHNHLLRCNNPPKRKASGSASYERNTHHDVPQNSETDPKNYTTVFANGLHTQEKRTVSTAAVIHPREIPNKPKYKLSTVKHQPFLERRYKQNTWQRREKDTTPPRPAPVLAPRRELTEPVIHEDTDSASDLSDTERLGEPTSTSDLPQLQLRKEVIDPSDFQPSRGSSRSHAVSRDSYPDFLPPPFNSWSLRDLAGYLNTDGKNLPRSRPVNQFERYLDRLLQLEWRQILTLHEESSKPILHERRRPHFSLSAPKSMLQCQRAFAFTLPSSVHPQICTYSHHTHLLTEKNRHSRRSSSETRAHRVNRVNDSSTDHLKRMQAIGNIRNPPTNNLSVNSSTSLDPLRRKGSGVRSRSCGGERKDSCRRTRSDRKRDTCSVKEIKLVDATGSEKETVASRTTSKHKHVQFFVQEHECYPTNSNQGGKGERL